MLYILVLLGGTFGIWYVTLMLSHSAVFILLLVARSKLVPDFALTIHLLHLLVVSFYSRSIPRNIFWWELQGASAALMTGLGMWACQWRELKPIAFGGRAKTPTQGQGTAEVEDGVGNVMGDETGRGADGAGVYEMIGMKGRG